MYKEKDKDKEKENEKDKNTYLINQSINRSKANILNNLDNSYFNNNLHLNSFFLNQKSLKSCRNVNIFKDFKNKNVYKENVSTTHFNIFDYYCFRKIIKSQKRTEIELFNFGINFYKRQMDIINFFNIIILTQIMLTHQSDKKQNILSQKIELSMK